MAEDIDNPLERIRKRREEMLEAQTKEVVERLQKEIARDIEAAADQLRSQLAAIHPEKQ